MKKLPGVPSIFYKSVAVLLLCGIGQTAVAQFQTTIGFPHPVSERSPGGVVSPGGGFALPAGNFFHPSGPFSPGVGDWELVFLNANGVLAGPSKWYGRPSDETAVWMEVASCSGQNHFIIAGNDGADMTLTLTNLAGDPVWTKRAGTTQNIESAACVKVDGSGNFVLVGTQIDVVNGFDNAVVVKVDCQGNLLWDRVFTVSGWSIDPASVTAFSTFIGICPQPNTNLYYITGKMTPLAGGDPRVFLLAVDATNGTPNFLINYDVNPGAEDIGTCIQSNCLNTAQPEIWISGYSYDAGVPEQTVLLLKTDINGAPIWANNYDVANGDEFATHFILNPNGKLTLTGKAEEHVVFQGTKDGNCLLMQVDGSGNTVDWTHLYINNGFSSQGNRVEAVPGGGGYFVSGQALELISPSQSANNILALQTDANGGTAASCYHDTTVAVISRPPMVTTFGIPQFTFGALDFFSNNGVDTISYTDQQTFCQGQGASCVCDFTYSTGNCFQVTFTAACMPPGNYTYEWDINCDGPDATTTTPTYSYTFPCGGGQYNVCLNVYLNGMLCSSISHVVTVPSTCCGPILTKSADCTPINNIYRFVIEVGDAPGASTCQQPVVTINSTVATLSNLNYTYLGSSWLVTGFAQVVTSKTTNLVFTVQTVCLCPVSGLPMTCNQLVSIPLPCCKVILVDDQAICHDLNVFNVPIVTGSWSPLMMISQVTWYVLPKPLGGCPPSPWGGKPYQDNLTSNLEPLHLYPSSLPVGEYCVYAVVHLDDGPCQLLSSNIATLTICEANSCTLKNYAYCYSGTPVPLLPIDLTVNTPSNACPVISIEWFDPQGSLVQTGGNSYSPTQSIGMQNDLLCYEDTFFTVKITDACGIHTCQSRIRIYSALAPVGTLTMAPPEPPFLCATNKDATLKFIPECAGDPPMWDWYQQDCKGSPVMPLPDAGPMNDTYNTGQLDESYYFFVEATNGVCPPKQTSLLVEYKSPLSYNNFSASADPCVEQYVDLQIDIAPCNIEGCNTPCTCTYTVDWYQNGNYIGTTPNVTPPNLATFHYTTLPLYGTYFGVVKADCCPGESVTTYPISFRQSCEPLVMGPCFVCDSVPVTLMAQMVLPPDDPCPDICTFSWFYYDPISQTETPLGAGPTWTTNYGGCYILESDCYGCIKRDTFKLGECYSNPCRRTFVSVEELFIEGQTPLRVYPNPASDVITVEWLGESPINAQLNIVDLAGRLIRTIKVPDAAAQLTISVDELPSGMFFVQVQEGGRLYRAAKLVVE